MYLHHSESFICPVCGKALSLEIFSRDEDWILDGLYSCPDKIHCFPVIDGTPRLLKTQLLTQVVNPRDLENYLKKYGELLPGSFLEKLALRDFSISREARVANYYYFQWQKYGIENEDLDCIEFQRLTGGKIDFSEYGGKSAIDMGAGQGRYTKFMLEEGLSLVVCVDLGEAINITAKRFRNYKQVLCIQASLFEIPLKEKFDLVLCIGVLHHLPDPGKGFHQLLSVARESGSVFAWVYGDSSIKPVLLILRKVSLLIPIRLLWIGATLPAFVRYLISCSGSLLRKAGLKSLASSLPFSMYQGYSFHYLWVNTFDHVSAQIINFFKLSDFESWMKEDNLTHYEIIERFPGKAGSSWFIHAKK